MTTAPAQEPPLTRLDLRDELDRTLTHCATKADVANLKVWIVGLLLVVVLNVVGTAGAIVAAFLARQVAASAESSVRESLRQREPCKRRPISEQPIDADNHAIKALCYWLYDRFGAVRPRGPRRSIPFRIVTD